ncbi:MAG: DUF2577 domain-containing protein [Clostridia bacterium]|nr:DUF2577 domain-containing protein [Clostridia bacterium]
MKKDTLLSLIKEAALDAVKAQKPTSYFYGTVISISPLKVQLSTNLILEKEFLVVPKSLTDYEINIEMDCSTETMFTDTKHTHEVDYTDKYTSSGDEENKTVTSETGSFDNTHSHKIKGTKTIVIYNALKINDKVILAQVQGGQDFIILDKVG